MNNDKPNVETYIILLTNTKIKLHTFSDNQKDECFTVELIYGHNIVSPYLNYYPFHLFHY